MLRNVLKVTLPTMVVMMMNALKDVGLAAVNIAWPISAVVMATGVEIGTGGIATIIQG